jgi:iron complex outermembrane receptor protein
LAIWEEERKMKGKTRSLLILAVLIMGMYCSGTGISWGADSGTLPTGVTPDTQTVIAQADAAAPPAPAANEAPAQTTTTQSTAPSETKAAAPDTKNVPVTEVEVKAEKPREGSAEVGYKVEDVTTTGPWGEMKLQDTPYSISVMSEQLIENVQASSPEDLFKMNPFVQIAIPQRRGDTSYIYMRGFASDTQNKEDGLPFVYDPLVDLEDKERVEILSGASGFLYGAANPGGTINYVLKRPTDIPLYDVTAGNYVGGGYFVHGDFGGPLCKDGTLGYRLNIVEENGDTAIDHQNIDRQLVSGALDWHITNRALLQFTFSYSNYDLAGVSPSWHFGNGVRVPPPPDESELWSQKYSFEKTDTYRSGTRLTWDINDKLTMRAAFTYSDLTKENLFVNNLVTNNSGTYKQQSVYFSPIDYSTYAQYGFLDYKLETGPIDHKFTLGYYGYSWVARVHQDELAAATFSGFDFITPIYIPEPLLTAGNLPMVKAQTLSENNFIIGDDLRLSEKWSILVGANYASIGEGDYDATTLAKTYNYNKSELTPTASLIFKPIQPISLYATYMEALEQGGTAPSTAANANEILPPYTDHQYEAGAKATLCNTLWTLAFFRIDKALQFVDPADNIYKQEGLERHTGVEFSATGKPISDLTIVGGVTLMDPKIVHDQANPQLDGENPVGVAKEMAKIYAEYKIRYIPGITLTGGVYYTGKSPINTTNTAYIPGFTTCDLGARYESKIFAHPVIYRLTVSNIFDKDYWAGTSGYYMYTGSPRSIAFSGTMRF